MPPSTEDQAQLDLIRRRFDVAEKGAHKKFRDRSDRLYALYSNYTEWRNSIGTDRRDRDQGIREGQREWGAELFIPYSFTAVESVLPRMIANTPRVIVKPAAEQWEDNAENMKYVVDRQYANIDYELVLQDIGRDALIGGLGVQKCYWGTRTRNGKKLARPMERSPGGADWVAVPQSKTVFDDPILERVDPYDFIWDPFAAKVQGCGYLFHRTWRSTDYVKDLIEQKIWTYDDPDRRSLEYGAGGTDAYTSTWSKRMSIDGNPGFKADDIHEVWEYHDGEKVYTVLDRQCIVQQGDNPSWHGEYPFQVTRPTRRPGKLDGRGVIEPMEDLQEEINTVRSQRRDNATISLQRSFFYAEGMIDPGDFKIGPGLGIATLGDPREAVFPVPISDIPNSGYQEESALQADIMRVSGVDDTAAGSGAGVQQTATGTQLVYQAQSARIKQMTRNLEIELVRSGGRQVMALNQQKILRNRDVQIPAVPEPGGPDRRWAWRQIGPEELQGEFTLEVEGGTMAPENVPQKRQDAQAWLAASQNPAVNPQKAMWHWAKSMDIEDPESVLAQQPPQVPAQVLEQFGQMLTAAGVDPGLIAQAQHAVLAPKEK